MSSLSVFHVILKKCPCRTILEPPQGCTLFHGIKSPRSAFSTSPKMHILRHRRSQWTMPLTLKFYSFFIILLYSILNCFQLFHLICNFPFIKSHYRILSLKWKCCPFLREQHQNAPSESLVCQYSLLDTAFSEASSHNWKCAEKYL